jgi:hypothetical protein
MPDGKNPEIDGLIIRQSGIQSGLHERQGSRRMGEHMSHHGTLAALGGPREDHGAHKDSQGVSP